MMLKRLGLLFFVVGLFAAAACLSVMPPPPLPTTGPAKVLSSSESVTIDASSAPVGTTEAALSRPLFTWSRRPLPDRPPPAASVAPEPEAPLPDLALRGSIISAEVRIAVLEQPGQTDYIRVPEGGRVGEWTIIKLEPLRVVMKSGSREIELNLQLPSAPPVP